MKQRCLNPNCPDFKFYGGRGINISPEWLDFDNFQRDVGPGFRPNLTLERIDNDGSYCKDNCRWVTRKDQANNRRTNRFLTYNGETKTLEQWASLLGIKPRTVWMRLYQYNWPIEKAFSRL